MNEVSQKKKKNGKVTLKRAELLKQEVEEKSLIKCKIKKKD